MTIKDNRRHHFFQIDNEVIDNYGPAIGAIGIAIYSAIVRHAGADGSSYPSHDTIATKTGVSRRSVIQYLSRMAGEDKERVLQANNLPPLIRIHRRKRKDGGLDSNVYELLPVPKDSHTHAQGIHMVCAQDAHKEDTVNKTEDTNVSSRPAIDPAKALVLALYNDVLGLDGPTAWPKAMRQAKSLVAAGCTPEEVRAIGKWLMADTFWSSKGIDMGAIQSQRDKWRATQAKVAPSTAHRQPTYANSVDPYDAQLLAGLEDEE